MKIIASAMAKHFPNDPVWQRAVALLKLREETMTQRPGTQGDADLDSAVERVMRSLEREKQHDMPRYRHDKGYAATEEELAGE